MGQVSSISMATPGILGLDACTSIGSFSKQDEMTLDLQNTLPSRSNSPDAIDTIAALLEDPHTGQNLYKALRNASKSVPPALFNAWAALADQAVRVGIDYRTLGLGWSHPNTRRQYRLGQHASISCPESRARAEQSRSFLHDVLMEALNQEAAYGAASKQSRLEEALTVAFLHEIGAPVDFKASASGILLALRTELLMPLRAINEGHIHRTFQGQPLPLPEVAATVRALTEAVLSPPGGYAAWRYTNPVGMEQLRGLNLLQISHWRHPLVLEHGEGSHSSPSYQGRCPQPELRLVTHEGDESELNFFWATKIGGPSHGFDYEAQCLLPLLCNARHKVILVNDPHWPDYPCGRCHFRLLWAEIPASPESPRAAEPHSPPGPKRSRSVPALHRRRSNPFLNGDHGCAPRLWLEGLHGDFEAVQNGLGRNWLPHVLRHAVVKACQLQVSLLVDRQLMDLLRAVAEDTGGLVCESTERMVLRPSNGVVEASDYLSRRHDWVQLEEEVTEPMTKAKFVPVTSV
ncbi:HERC2 [Symbiodinium sp. CCMP2456]|nr:HERC2 [Symbiodinium sp. CCMP2456]